MFEYLSPLLAESSLAVWSSVRPRFQNGVLFLSADLADAVARCPGAQALYDLGAACLLSLEDHPAELRAAANTFPANEQLNVCFAINTLLSDASDTIVDLVKGLPCQCVVTVLTTVSSSAHESYASTTLEADAYDYILSLWEETFLSYGCPRHSLSVQYFPIHVKVLGGVGFHLLLSDTASKAIKNDILASTTNDVTYVRQVLSTAEQGIGDEGNTHELEVLAHALAGLRANFSIRPSLFAAGPVARKVSQLMHGLPTWPQPLLGTSPHTAALVLVDRAADLSEAMRVPHTLSGLGGSAPGPAWSSATVGCVGRTWWQAAAGRDDGFAAAEMALQGITPSMDSESILLAASVDLNSRFRSGQVSEWSPLIAHAARQCIADQDAAQSNAIQFDSLPMSALDGRPLDSASFAKAFGELVQAPIETGNVLQASILIVSMRALVIGLASLFRQGGGAGHMDPIDAFLSMYGSRIYDALARAVDHEAAVAKCSVKEYIQSLRGGPCQSTQLQPSGKTHTASSSLHMVPVSEASAYRFRMLYCDSMSIHSSDAGVDDLAQAIPESVCPLFESSMPEATTGTGQPVAEATEWSGGWGDDWDEPVPPQEAGTDGASAGWGADGWGEGGDWMDAPVPMPAVSSAAQEETGKLHAPVASSSIAEVNASAPIKAVVRPATIVCSVAAGEGTDEITAAFGQAAAEHPKKVVKKKIIKKVVKKVVRRKVRAGLQSTGATGGTGSITPDVHDPASLVQAVPVAEATGTASAASAVVAEPAPMAPEVSESCVPGVDLQPLQSDEAPVEEVQPTHVLGYLPKATDGSHHEPVVQDMQLTGKGDSAIKQHQGYVSTEEQSKIVALDSPVDVAGLTPRLDKMVATCQSAADDGVAPAGMEEEAELTRTATVPRMPAPDVQEIAMHGSRNLASNEAPCGTGPPIPEPGAGALLGDLAGAGSGHDSLLDAPPGLQNFTHPEIGGDAVGGGDADTNPMVASSSTTGVWSDDPAWGGDAGAWDNGLSDAAAEAAQLPLGDSVIARQTEYEQVQSPQEFARPEPVESCDHLLRDETKSPEAEGSQPQIFEAKEGGEERDEGRLIDDFSSRAKVDAQPLVPQSGNLSSTSAVVAAENLPQDADVYAAKIEPNWGGQDKGWGSDGWGEMKSLKDVDHGTSSSQHADGGQIGQGWQVAQPEEQHSAPDHKDECMERNAPEVPGLTGEVRVEGVDRGWADRAAAASDSTSWTGAWFVRGLESIASKVEAVVMSPASVDEDGGTRELPSRPTLAQTGNGGSWGPEQWEGWGSRLSTAQRPLRLAREVGSTASLPAGPFDAISQVADTSHMAGVDEENEEGVMVPPAVIDELPDSHLAVGDAHDQAGAAGRELDSSESGLTDQAGSAVLAGGRTSAGDIRSDAMPGDSGTGMKQAVTLAVVAEDQELGASGGLVDGSVLAVPNAAVVAEVSAGGLRHTDRGWGDNWSDATTLGTHADMFMLTEDASMITASPDVASVSADPGDVAGASPGGSPPGSGTGTDVGFADVGTSAAPPRDTGAQGLSALAVHMHDAEASYVDATGTSVRGTSEEASRPDWSVVSTLGTDALAAGMPTEESAMESTPLGVNGQGAGALAAAVRGATVRGVDLKQVGKELGWSIASTGDSAGGREAGTGASGVPERTASPRKRLQEVVPEDVMGTRELHDAAERLLEAGWGDGWSDAATLGTQAEFEAAVLGSGTGDGPGGGDAGADLQIVDEEGDAGGWGAGWGEDIGETGEWQSKQNDETNNQGADAADSGLPAEQSWPGGDDGWSGWDTWGDGTAQHVPDPAEGGALRGQQNDSSSEGKAFAQALVRIACRCARAAGPTGGIVDKVVRSAKGKLRESHLEGVTHVKGAVGSILSHGLGALGLGSADPTLAEFARVVVVVLGGITMEEVATVSQAVNSASDSHVDIVFGGVHLTTAENLASVLMKSA